MKTVVPIFVSRSMVYKEKLVFQMKMKLLALK